MLGVVHLAAGLLPFMGGSWRSKPLPPGWAKTRLRILRRDDWRCYRCGRRNANEVDHVIPAALGGSDEDDNLAAICVRCHRIKTAEDRAAVRAKRSKVRKARLHPGMRATR